MDPNPPASPLSIPNETRPDDGGVGVYVHLPFCEHVCPYCDFAVVAAPVLHEAVETRYAAALLREIEARRGDFEGRRLATIYLGGGTPSMFRPATIAEIVSGIRSVFEGEPVETTLELNPGNADRERLAAWREAGVDRLSIGVQSFDDVTLRRLGRGHGSKDVRATLDDVRAAGFENVSLDLIFAVPGRSLAAVDRDLEAVLDFEPEHVSSYELTFEPRTPFGHARAAGRMTPPDEDLVVEMIERIESRLERAGLERYEISSYAKPGRRAQHNARYWQRQSVLGLGVGAHSFEARTADRPHGARRANPRRLESWLDAVEAGRPAGELETLDLATARGEAVFLALRQREGLSAARFSAEFGVPPRSVFGAEIERLRTRGWLHEGDPGAGDLRLTRAGRLVADSVAAEFVASG